jgi:hypothetical protein
LDEASLVKRSNFYVFLACSTAQTTFSFIILLY